MNKENVNTILVTGATGTVGNEVVKQLTPSGHIIKAAVHTHKAEYLRQFPQVDTVNIDFADPVTISNALIGVDRLFLVTPVTPDMDNITAKIIQEAKNKGVKYIVKLSAAGADSESGINIGRLHRKEEKMIEDTDIEYNFLRPMAFMQNFVSYFGETIRKQNAIYTSAGEGKISFIDARDIASVAVQLLTNNDTKYKNKSLELTGQEALSYGQAAEKLSEELGRKISHIDVSEEEARKDMKKVGMSDWLIDDIMKFYGIIRLGYASQITNTIEEITGKRPILFSQFAKDYAKALE
jgi:uncharacterized protein YbjT (DUF2867 family)